MNSLIKLWKPSIIMVLGYLLCLALYWESMAGFPIWDDLSFLFEYPPMQPDFSYLEILRKFSWPLSLILQKLMLSWWGEEYLYYHLVNLLLHFANSWLVLLLGQRLKIRYPIILAVLFLLHPANVISVAWMVQFKTLLCFFFGLLAILQFCRHLGKPSAMVLSWVFFAASMTSKSSSLFIPVVISCLAYGRLQRKQYLFLIPFFLISAFGLTRMVTIPTIRGISRAVEIAQTSAPREAVEMAKKTYEFPAQTLRYYFWQSVLPVNNIPVKGLNFERASWEEWLHLAFLLLLGAIFWRERGFWFLLLGHLFLTPYLGIIPAPFMTITWVSDQHLYLALPALLAFWLRVSERIKIRFGDLLPLLLLPFYIFKTSQAVEYYKDQPAFYSASLLHNPFNLPISYNLAFHYFQSGDVERATRLIQTTLGLVEHRPSLKGSRYYESLVNLLGHLESLEQTP